MNNDEECRTKESLSFEFYNEVFDKPQRIMMRALVLLYATQFGDIDETEAFSALLSNMVLDQAELMFEKGFVEAIYMAVSKSTDLSDKKLFEIMNYYKDTGQNNSLGLPDGSEPFF